MKPLALTKTQLIIWLIAATGGCILLMTHLPSFGATILFLSSFIIMTPSERSRPVRGRDFLYLALGLLAFVGFVLAVGHWVPVSYTKAAVGFTQHPAVVIPFWLVCVALVCYRRRLWQTGWEQAKSS